jgi:hypothetical protein
MTTVKYIGTIINIIYILMVALFVLDVFSILEIKGELLKSFIHFGSLFVTPIIVIYNIFIRKSRRWNIWIGTTSLSMVLCFSIIVSKQGVLGYLFSMESWNTQTVLYEHGNFGSKRIEFQMQDMGALGYNKRYVSVTYITDWFMITKEIDPNKIFGSEWIRVDKDVNELEIKSP